MRSIVVIFAICFLAVASAENDDYIPKKNAHIDECKSEQNVGDDVAKIVDNKVLPENEQQKCFLECFYTKIGLLAGGKLSSEGVQRLAQKKYGSNQEKLNKATDVFNKCAGAMNDEQAKEKCFYGKAIRECFINHQHDLSLVFP